MEVKNKHKSEVFFASKLYSSPDGQTEKWSFFRKFLCKQTINDHEGIVPLNQINQPAWNKTQIH
jgi:hypothetical protein